MKKLLLSVLGILVFVLLPNFTLIENQPIRVTLNNRPLFNAVVITDGTKPGAQNAIIAVLLKDFLTVSGAGMTMEPAFEQRGRELWATGRTSSAYKEQVKYKESALVPAVQLKWTPGQFIAPQKAGRIGTIISVVGPGNQVLNYLSLQEVASAMGDGSVRGTLSGGVRPPATLNLRPGVNGILIGLSHP